MWTRRPSAPGGIARTTTCWIAACKRPRPSRGSTGSMPRTARCRKAWGAPSTAPASTSGPPTGPSSRRGGCSCRRPRRSRTVGRHPASSRRTTRSTRRRRCCLARSTGGRCSLPMRRARRSCSGYRKDSREECMTTAPAIRSIRAGPVQVPFKRPPISASGALPHAALVLIDLETEEGLTGRSYLFGFAPWTLRPILGCLDAMGDMLKGDAVSPFEIEAKLRKRLTLIDTPGLVGLALAGVDMCAWDVLAQAASLPLARLLGGELKPIRAYNSCGLWIQPVETLADEHDALMAEGGFSAIKLRLGRDDPAEDLAAVRAVKKRVGDKITVMCDYNQRLTVNEAILRGRMLDGEGLYWIEEPVRHDDYAGCARIAAELRTPLQTGENLVDA